MRLNSFNDTSCSKLIMIKTHLLGNQFSIGKNYLLMIARFCILRKYNCPILVENYRKKKTFQTKLFGNKDTKSFHKIATNVLLLTVLLLLLLLLLL